jgi:F0F1-type ATP synthase membrane subunit b/b'
MVKTYSSVKAVSRRGEARSLNEQRIQQVLDIEKKAQRIHESAVKEAAQLQEQAKHDAQALLERTRAAAQEKAQQVVADAHANEECARIRAESEEKSRQMETLAAQHFDRAVAYVLDRLTGKE